MSTTTCPACNAAIDPARAPVARVRGGRVVTFCSQACADAPGAAGRAASQAEPAADSGRVVAGADGAGDSAPVPAPYEAAGRRPRGSARQRVIALSAAILIGGMVITIVNAVSPSTPVDVRAHETPEAPRAPEAAASAPPVASAPPEADPYVAAQGALRALLQSPSPRVQRIAAMALSRLGPEQAPEAIEVLVRLVEEDPSELGRVEVAYALARAGDARGRKLLREALGHDRRDVRLDAAGSLVALGDDAGNRVLEHLLDLDTHRLGVAALLARRGNEEGLSVLREVLTDEDASPELVMRATVALGRAGDASVRDRLVEILADGRFQVGAADALAALKEPVAVPALIRQLELSSLRVRAALWLRRLQQEVALDGLVAALQRGSDGARVSAAEAILILAGPKHLAELD